jgi:8-oxo-dGTP pyrophosphatase MutT (NUDIX family)
VTDLLAVDGANPWQTLSRRIVFDDGRLCLHEDQVIQPDGRPGRYAYLSVATPIVAIVPVDDKGNVHLVRQWRYPWGHNSWELPSGGADRAEEALAAAQRELAEEAGLRATQWVSLAGGYSSASIRSEWHFFLARGLREVSTHQRDGSEQDLIARPVPLPAAIEAALDGRIAHGMSVVGLLRAARRLGI